MCELFGCAPDIAQRQDAVLVDQIMEYRAAKRAIELMNGGKEDKERLEKAPALVNLLREIDRAQVGKGP